MSVLYDREDKKLIKFIGRTILKHKCNSYSKIREELKCKYTEMTDEDLNEELDKFKSKTIVISSTAPENLTLGCISAMSILVVIGSTIDGLKNKSTYIAAYLVIIIIYIFLLRYRIQSKGKQLACYKFAISEIEKELERRIKKSTKNRNLPFYGEYLK